MIREPLPGVAQRRQLFADLLGYQGAATAYWERLLETAVALLAPEAAAVYALAPGGDRWQLLAHQPRLASDRQPSLSTSVSASLLQQARAESVAVGASASGTWRVALGSIRLEQGQRELALVLHLGPGSAAEPLVLQWLSLLVWAPQWFERDRQTRASERDATRLAQALELVGRVLEAPDLDRAALVLANELAERFACETVSVSWRAREGLRLRAISHAEKVDRRTELSALIEEAGQEAIVQGVELVWPGSGNAVTRAHDHYASVQHPGHLLTVPLMDRPEGSGAVSRGWGAITLERHAMAFTTAEQWAVRLMADVVLKPLIGLHHQSRALPIRLLRESGRSLPRSLRPVSVAGRRLLTVAALGFFALCFVPVPYSVDAGAQVKTDAMAFIGAPFDGYLASSAVALGDTVRAGQVLFELSPQELRLERASLLADIAQASREAEKRRSANQLPEMQMAEAQVAQIKAKLQQVDERIVAARASSPIAGVVIEGEPGKNLGGAVRRGDVVVKVAAIQSLYIEAALPERDLSRIAVGDPARLTLLANPASTFDLKVARIIPQASVKDGANTFPIRLEPSGEAAAWWRPGMSGVAKIDLGWKPLAWVATHRLIDFFRVFFWI